MANRQQIKILKSGARAWEIWKNQNSALIVDLENADLRNMDLTGVNLSGLNLRGTIFRNSILRNANLRSSILVDASFRQTELTGTAFDHSTMGETSFVEVDLSMAQGLESVIHKSASFVELSTISFSQGRIPESFLRDAGVPLLFIDRTRQLVEAGAHKRFYCCFISYSRYDLAVVERVEQRLQNRGIQCWRDDHEMLPGDTLHTVIGQSIMQQDRLLLFCSRHSLTSPWVDREIQIALEKELEFASEGKSFNVLIPADLDGHLFSDECKNAHRDKLMQRLAADFANSETDWVKLNSQVDKLVRALTID